MADCPVPVALITGFLGSGKTTLLKTLAARYGGRRIAWIVNDFGALDIDAEALRAGGMEVVSIAGGSMLCRCLATPFRRVMRSVADKASAGQLDGVIIEASGIARPSGMDRMLSEFSLDTTLSVDSVTCVVDPARFLTARASLACVAEQVQCSDCVLLNKADTVDAAVLAAVEADIRGLSPAPVLRCVHCAVDLDVLAWKRQAPMDGPIAEEPDRAFARYSAQTEDVQDMERLREEITAIAPTLYRCKGILRTNQGPSGWVMVDWTPGGLDVRPFGARKPERCGLVFIAREGMEGPAQNLCRAIQQGRFCPA